MIPLAFLNNTCEFLLFGGYTKNGEESDKTFLFRSNVTNPSESELLEIETCPLPRPDNFESNIVIPMSGQRVGIVGDAGLYVFDKEERKWVESYEELGQLKQEI